MAVTRLAGISSYKNILSAKWERGCSARCFLPASCHAPVLVTKQRYGQAPQSTLLVQSGPALTNFKVNMNNGF
jgi:hypothetical protein